jgi:outer membrane receptor protein involved in Fe transport
MPSFGQGTVRATVQGVVSDSSGAVEPGVSIELKNVETDVTHTSTTTSSGTYSFPYMDPGAYSLTASKDGFQTVVIKHIIVTSASTVPVNVTLQVGSVSQQVQVTAETQQLDPTNVGSTAMVSAAQLEELPNNGQQYAQLIRLDPGVVAGYLNTGSSSGSNFGGSGYIAGRRIGDNVVYIDGGMFYDPWSPSQTVSGLLGGPGVSQDAIAEFQVVANNPNPDEGFTAGGRIDLTTKGGTNELHGTAYEFLRNQVFDARNYFTAKKLPFKRNLFGGTLGGPIKKEKLFYFGSYEGMRQRKLIPQAPVVPTPLLLADIPGGPSYSYLQQLLENQFPLPVPGTYSNTALVAVYNTSSDAAINYDIFSVRTDYVLNPKNTLSTRYIFNQANGSPGAVTSTGIPTTNGGANDRWQQPIMSWTTTFSPSLVNEARFSFQREYNAFPAVSTPTSLVQCCSIAASVDSPNGLPYITFGGTGLTAVGPLARKPQWRADNDFQVDDSMTGLRGHHSYTFGGTFMSEGVNDVYPQGLRAQVAFSGFGAPFDTSSTGVTTGNVYSETQTFALSALGYERGVRRRQFAFFGQDVWHATRNLTLTLGLRYEYVFSPFAVDNGLNNLYPTDGGTTPIAGQNITNIADTTIATVGSCSGCLSLARTEKTNFLPRLGVAWNALPSTIVRAGFGMQKGEMIFNLLSFNRANPGFTKGVEIAQAPFTLDLAAAPEFNPPVFAYDPGMGRPYTEDWNLDVEHAFGQNTTARVAYVGNRGADLFRPFAPNYGAGYTGTRPNATFGQVTLWEANSMSWYNSLEAEFQRRLSHDLSFQLSYTYAKSLDYASGEVTAFSDLNYPSDPADPALDKGRSDFDLRNVFIGNVIYGLPVGTGKVFLSSAHGVAQAALGGWQVSSVVSVDSGQPLSFLSGVDLYHDGFTDNARALFLVPHPSELYDRSGLPKTQFFNPAAVGIEISSTTGTPTGRNIVDGPSYANVDFGLFKEFTLTPRRDKPLNMEFRWQAYNLFNHTNFAQPNSTVSSPVFGRITATVSDPRDMEFTLKFKF